jgi:hypothetical protein
MTDQMKPVTLRSSLDKPGATRSVAIATEAADGAPTFDPTAAPAPEKTDSTHGLNAPDQRST